MHSLICVILNTSVRMSVKCFSAHFLAFYLHLALHLSGANQGNCDGIVAPQNAAAMRVGIQIACNHFIFIMKALTLFKWVMCVEVEGIYFYFDFSL